MHHLMAVKLSVDELRKGKLSGEKKAIFTFINLPRRAFCNKRNFDLKLIFHFISLQQKLDKIFSSINLFHYVLLCVAYHTWSSLNCFFSFSSVPHFTQIKVLMSFTQKGFDHFILFFTAKTYLIKN